MVWECPPKQDNSEKEEFYYKFSKLSRFVFFIKTWKKLGHLGGPVSEASVCLRLQS